MKLLIMLSSPVTVAHFQTNVSDVMEIALPVQSAVAAPQWTLHPAPPFL
jgi:hypothetical protein